MNQVLHGKPQIEIFIDEVPFNVDDKDILGSELRALPEPDVPPNRDLFQESPGQRDDTLVIPTERYRVHKGTRFYTAPSTINPGAREC